MVNIPYMDGMGMENCMYTYTVNHTQVAPEKMQLLMPPKRFIRRKQLYKVGPKYADRYTWSEQKTYKWPYKWMGNWGYNPYKWVRKWSS